MEGFSTDNITKTCKIIFVEYGSLCKIVPDVGTNFISEKVKSFSKKLSI